MPLAPWFREGSAEPIEDGRIQYGPGKGWPKLVFPGRDELQRPVGKIATVDPVRKKTILIQPGDKVPYLSGLRKKGFPDIWEPLKTSGFALLGTITY
ncbi:hypothetical protein [Paracidovorax anthurii]|uniref:hypothetical protein n=1 Tax=Paracidovorax anthurii TaxID=78229 RepID=UPI001B8862FE|nr:hypothetical protein [Paracidovorax anthurii]